MRFAADAGLRGNQQLRLAQFTQDVGARWRHQLIVGRKAMAKELEVDDRNTQRRLHRLQALGLLSIVQGGGRMAGTRKLGRRGLKGRANRYYPGPKIVDALLVARWIREDDAAAARKLEPARAPGEPPPDHTAFVDAARVRELARLVPTRAGP